MDQIGNETEVEYLHDEVVIAEAGVEGLFRGVAQCEVQVHLQKTTKGHQNNCLEGDHGAESSEMRLQCRPGVSVPPVEYHWS